MNNNINKREMNEEMNLDSSPPAGGNENSNNNNNNRVNSQEKGIKILL